MTPKSLLRHRLAVSPLEDFESGRFLEVLDDATIQDPEHVRRIVLCSGKVYYDLLTERERLGKTEEVAIIRLEQFHPLPAYLLKPILDRYSGATEWIWAQEESQNNGGWTFVAPRLKELTGNRLPVRGP